MDSRVRGHRTRRASSRQRVDEFDSYATCFLPIETGGKFVVMTRTATLPKLVLFACGIIVGVFLMLFWKRFGPHTTKAVDPEIEAMQNDIAHLKAVVPSQSHAMTDVAFQFSNLWFAGKENNWRLAAFFLHESRHKASGKPFPRPMVPTVPPQTIINFDLSSTWPQ